MKKITFWLLLSVTPYVFAHKGQSDFNRNGLEYYAGMVFENDSSINSEDTLYHSFFSQVELRLFYPLIYRPTTLRLEDGKAIMQDWNERYPPVVLPKAVSDSIFYCLYRLYIKNEPRIKSKKKREIMRANSNHELLVNITTKGKKPVHYEESYWGKEGHETLIIEYSKPLDLLFDIIIKATFQYNSYCQIMNSKDFKLSFDTLSYYCDSAKIFQNEEAVIRQVFLTVTNQSSQPVWVFFGENHPVLTDYSVTDPYRWNGKQRRKVPYELFRRDTSYFNYMWKTLSETWIGDFFKIIPEGQDFKIVITMNDKDVITSPTIFDITDFMFVFTQKQMEEPIGHIRRNLDYNKMSYPHDIIVLPFDFIRNSDPYKEYYQDSSP